MNTFLAESVIRREFHFNRYNLTDCRQRQNRSISPPGDE